MKRSLTLLTAVAAAASILALPAEAGSAHHVFGSITALTSHTISVQAPGGIVTTCAVGRRSPQLAAFSAGDRVEMLCRAGRPLSVLAHIRRLAGSLKAAKTRNGSATVDGTTAFGGAITALSDSSISLHDGDRDLTCAIDASSPATSGFEVGQHVKVTCTNGTLSTISGLTSADVGRWFTGTVASIGDTSITVTTDHGPVTCTLAAGSPSVAGLQAGDQVGIGCNAATMQLVLVRKLADSTDGSGSGSDSGATGPSGDDPQGGSSSGSGDSGD